MTLQPNDHPDTTEGHRRLETDPAVLEEWSETASQVDQNAVYEALFEVVDGSVDSTRLTVRHPALPEVATVFCRDDLIVAVADTDPGVFDVLYAGPPVVTDDEK